MVTVLAFITLCCKSLPLCSLDSWLVDVASDDANDFDESVSVSKEDHIATQIGRTDSIAQFRTLIANLWVL